MYVISGHSWRWCTWHNWQFWIRGNIDTDQGKRRWLVRGMPSECYSTHLSSNWGKYKAKWSLCLKSRFAAFQRERERERERERDKERERERERERGRERGIVVDIQQADGITLACLCWCTSMCGRVSGRVSGHVYVCVCFPVHSKAPVQTINDMKCHLFHPWLATILKMILFSKIS